MVQKEECLSLEMEQEAKYNVKTLEEYIAKFTASMEFQGREFQPDTIIDTITKQIKTGDILRNRKE